MADRVALHTGYYLDPKVQALRATDERLFLRLLAWCGANETGGILPRNAPSFVGVRDGNPSVSRLLSVGLLQEHESGGYCFPSWSEWQNHVDELAKRRKNERERKARQRSVSSPKSRDMSRDVPVTRGGEGSIGSTEVGRAALRSERASAPPHELSTHFADGTPIPGESAAVVPLRRDRGPAPSSAANALAAMHCPPGTPGAQIRALAVVVQELIDDPAVERADLEAALTAWRGRSDAGPRLLPSLVTDAAKARAGGSPGRASPMRGSEAVDAGREAARILAAAQQPTTAKELE